MEPPNFAGPLNIKAGLHQSIPDHRPPEPEGLANCHSEDNGDTIIEACTTIK